MLEAWGKARRGRTPLSLASTLLGCASRPPIFVTPQFSPLFLSILSPQLPTNHYCKIMVHRILEGGVLVVCPYIASQFDADSAFTVSAVPHDRRRTTRSLQLNRS